MKLKKRFIIIFLIFVFFIALFLIFKKNNIEISEIFNKNNKLATYTFQPNGDCEAWIDPSLINGEDKAFSTSDFIVIRANETNLKTSDGNTGYDGFAFINKYGCAVKVNDVTSTTRNNTAMCNAMKEFVNKQESLINWAEHYNSFVKSGYCTDKIVIPITSSVTCENYIKPSDAQKIAIFDFTKGGKRYQIIDAQSTTFGEGEGYEGFAFLVDGCETDIKDVEDGWPGFASQFGDNNTICSAMRSYITTERSKEDINNWNYWARYYNTYTSSGDTLVPGETGHEALGICSDSSRITTITETHTCTYDFKTGWPRWAYDGYVDYGWGAGASYTEEGWYNFILKEAEGTGCGCNEKAKYFVTNDIAKQSLINTCGSSYVLNETGFHTHEVTDSTGTTKTVCYKDGKFDAYGECPLECNQTTRNEIINNNDVDRAKKYNTLCKDESGFLKINFSKITLNWQGGWGPKTLGTGIYWSGGNGIYNIEGITGKNITINFDTKLINYNYELIGWSVQPECLNIIGSGGLNHNFTFEEANTTYYACYSGDVFEDSLFNASGTKKTGFGELVYESNSCDDSLITTSSITQVPMKQMNRYVKQSNQAITLDAVLGQENKYCNVMCTDTVDVYYPNIFETVPAGQYFELMYEPEIKASRTCKTEFRYDTWKFNYENALDNELTKLNELSAAQAYYNAANSLEYTEAGNCGCCCSGEECACTGSCDTKYSDTKSANFYKTTSSSLFSTSASASGCGLSAMSSSILSTQTSAANDLATAKTAYEEAVRERIRLEQFNLQCYTAVDSDKSNNVDIKYNDTLNITNNYEIIDNSFTYKTKAAKVNIDEDSYGTKGNYIDSITNNTSIEATELKSLSLKQYTTKEFYIINPKLNFKYDTGEQLSLGIKEKEEDLLVEGHVKNDTGSYTAIDEFNNYIKNTDTESFEKTFYLNGSYSTYIDFDAHTVTNNYRKVEYYFTFHEATEYCSKAQSGEILSGTTCSGLYSSLSKLTEYTNKSGSPQNIKNHVYPVSLNAVNDKYPIEFTLTENGTPIKNDYTKYTDFTKNYTCNYEITNDALTLKNPAPKSYKDLKNNTIFRSVATNEIDPNQRADTGNLGENWINAKGNAVRKSIKEKEEHGTSTNDTYNPQNLEYSFTLTPSIIKEIKNYNSVFGRTYDDFELTCATDDKRECTSDFLTDLSEGKVNGVPAVNNYSSINNWGLDDLNKIRKKWKYYIPSFDNTTLNNTVCTSLGNDLYICQQGKMTLENYNKLYEKWGVLP